MKDVVNLTTSNVNRTTLNRHRLCFAMQLYALKNNHINLYNVTVTLKDLLPYYLMLDDSDSYEIEKNTHGEDVALKRYYNKQIKHKFAYNKTSDGIKKQVNLTCLQKEGLFPNIKLTHRLMDHSEGRCPSSDVLSLGGGLGQQMTTTSDVGADQAMISYFREIGKNLPANLIPFRDGNPTYSFLKSVFEQTISLELHAEQIVFRKGDLPIYDIKRKPKPVRVGKSNKYWKSTTSSDYELKIPYVTTNGLKFIISFQLKSGTIEVSMRPYRKAKYAVPWAEYDVYLDFIFKILYSSLGTDYSNFKYDIVQYDLNNDVPKTQLSQEIIDIIEEAFRQEGKRLIEIEIEGFGVSSIAIYDLYRVDKGNCYRFEFRMDRKDINYESKGGTIGEIVTIIDDGLNAAVNRGGSGFKDVIRQSIQSAQAKDMQLMELIAQIGGVEKVVNGVARTLVYFADESEKLGQSLEVVTESQSRMENVVNYLLTETQNARTEMQDSVDQINRSLQVEVITSLSQNLMNLVAETQWRNDELSEMRLAIETITANTDKTSEAISLLASNQANIQALMEGIKTPPKTKEYEYNVVYQMDQSVVIKGVTIPNKFVSPQTVKVQDQIKNIKVDILVDLISYLFKNGWTAQPKLITDMRRRRHDVTTALHAGNDMDYFQSRKVGKKDEWNLTTTTKRKYSQP